MRVPRSGNGHRPYQLTDASPDDDGLATNGQARLVDALSPPRPLRRIAVKLEHRFLFVNTADIRWLEAHGNYVRLHLPDAVYDLRVSLGALLERLDPEVFLRVHRSIAANVNAIAEIDPRITGRHVITLCDGTRMTTSRKYRGEMRKLLYNRG